MFLKKALQLLLIFFVSFVIAKSASAAITIRPANNLGLVGYWSMDEDASLSIGDASGNRNNGFFYNAIDSFSMADTNPVGGNWTTINGMGNMRIISSMLYGASAGDNGAYWNACDPDTNQFSEIKYVGQYVSPLVRVSKSAKTFYYMYGSGGYYRLGRYVGEALTELATTTYPAANQIVKLVASGTNPVAISLYYDNILQLSYDDSSANRIQSGVIGVYSAESASYALDDWLGSCPASARPSGIRSKALSLNLNGGNERAIVPTSQSLRFNGNLTASLWLKTASLNGSNQTTLMDFSDWNNKKGWTLIDNGPYDGGNKITFRVLGSNTFYDVTITRDLVNDGKWHNLTGVRQGTTIYLYLDGVQKNFTEATTFETNTTGDLYIGDEAPISFIGLLDEVRIYNRALSPTEVANLYNASKKIIKAKTATDQGLVGYWSFDEGSGTKAGDMSGNGQKGALAGATFPTWTDGKRGKALSFDGSSNYVYMADNDIFAPNNISVFTWIKRGNNNSRVVSKDNRTDSRDFELKITSSNTVEFTVWNQAGSLTTVNGGSTVNTDWHLVGGTWDGSTVKTYLDGVLQDQGALSGTSVHNTGYELQIGQANGNEYFQGLIDEVRIYSRALSATEIANLYNASKKIMKINTSQNLKVTNGLVGLWSFNGPDIAGNTAFDRSGNNNNGTITGAKLDSGKIGQALSFDGSGDYVSVPQHASINDLATATVSMWFNVGDDGSFFIKDSGDTGALNILAYSDRRLELIRKYDGDDLMIMCLPGSFEYNQWTHLAVVYDGPNHNNAHIYLDGTECTYLGYGDGTSTLTSDAGGGLDINNPNAQMAGKIDEVRFYNRVLSAEEVKRLYQMGK